MKKSYVLIMDSERDRKSICELLEQIRRSCVTTMTLRHRIKRLRLFEGKLEVRAKTLKGTESGGFSLMRTLSLSSFTGGMNYEWKHVWAVLYVGRLGAVLRAQRVLCFFIPPSLTLFYLFIFFIFTLFSNFAPIFLLSSILSSLLSIML